MVSPFPRSASRFAPWRVVVWVVLLLAAFGVLQYSLHGWHVLQGLRQGLPDAVQARLRTALIVDVVYLLAACITLCLAAGTLLRRGWARPLLRLMVLLLAAGFLASAVEWLLHWSDFAQRTADLAAQPGLGAQGQALVARVKRSYAVGLALKLVAVPVLVWLSWRLGRPAIRAQFPPPRAR